MTDAVIANQLGGVPVWAVWDRPRPVQFSGREQVTAAAAGRGQQIEFGHPGESRITVSPGYRPVTGYSGRLLDGDEVDSADVRVGSQ